MLRRMFLGAPTASHDRILDFSTAVTGTLFFAPSVDFLDGLPDSASAATSVSQPADTPAAKPADGSLGIGDLNRSTAQ
jgi:putative iron-dependent peroxidase